MWRAQGKARLSPLLTFVNSAPLSAILRPLLGLLLADRRRWTAMFCLDVRCRALSGPFQRAVDRLRDPGFR